VVHLNFNPALALITFQEPDPDKVPKKTYVIHVFLLEGKYIFFKIEQSMFIKIIVSYKEVFFSNVPHMPFYIRR